MLSNRSRSAAVISAVATIIAMPALAQEGTDAALRPYLAGNGMLSRGMNELAAKEYRAFLKESPDHDRAPHARYGLAVALFRQDQFAEAASQLDGLVELKGFEFAAEAGYLLGQCALASGSPTDAALPLERVMKRHPEHALADDAAALLVEARYRAGALDDAVSSAGQLEKRWPESPVRDRAEYFAGLAEIGAGKETQASERLTKLVEIWPRSPLAGQAALLAGQCAHRANRPDAARAAYERILAEPEATLAPEALLGLASLEHAAKNLPAARRHMDRLLAEHGKSPQAGAALLQRGRVLLDAGELEAAREDFERYARMDGADPAAGAYWTAKCQLKGGKAGAAAKALAAAAGEHGDSELAPAILFDLAVAQAEAGREQEARESLGRFLERFGDHSLAPHALESLASLLHRAGEYPESDGVCERFRQGYPKHPLLARVELLSAENAFLASDLDRAEQAYRDFLAARKDDPNAALAEFRLGCVHFRRDEPEQARPLLERAAQRAGGNEAFRPALLYLGDMAFQRGGWQEAAARLQQYLEADPNGPGADDALLKRGIALANLGEHEAAARCQELLLTQFPKSDRAGLAGLERSRSLLALGRKDQAREQLTKLSRSSDSELAATALNRLAALAVDEADLAQAATLFARAAESSAGDAGTDALHGLGSVLLTQGRHEEAAAALDRLISGAPDYPRLPEAAAQRALARARLQRGDEALEALADVLRSADELPRALRHAIVYERTLCLRALGRAGEAGQPLRDLASSDADPSLRLHAWLDLARDQLTAGELDDAAASLASARPLLDDEGVSAGLREHVRYELAAMDYRRERWREAAEGFIAFAKEHESSTLAPSASLLAGESLVRLNQHQRAVEHLRIALKGKLEDPDRQTALLRLGDCLAAAQDWPGSERAFADFLERYSASELWFQARFGMGWALENQGRHEQAMAEYAKVTASHQGPTAARAQFQTGECLFALGRHEEAVRELLKVDILYAYPEWSSAALYEAGRCFEAMGKPDEATAHYRQVREKHPQTQWARLAAQRLNVLSSSAR